MKQFSLTAAFAVLTSIASVQAFADPASPMYKPSSRAPQPIDILTNAYGRSASAPNALRLSEKPSGFTLAKVGGGTVQLEAELARGPVVLVFYRGHW